MDDFGVVSDSKPIMVSGVYRSGTTFLTALLGAHPKLKASSSTVKFLRFCWDVMATCAKRRTAAVWWRKPTSG
jgi:hypothetical protein